MPQIFIIKIKIFIKKIMVTSNVHVAAFNIRPNHFAIFMNNFDNVRVTDLLTWNIVFINYGSLLRLSLPTLRFKIQRTKRYNYHLSAHEYI